MVSSAQYSWGAKQKYAGQKNTRRRVVMVHEGTSHFTPEGVMGFSNASQMK